jgi:hypothetical protein
MGAFLQDLRDRGGPPAASPLPGSRAARDARRKLSPARHGGHRSFARRVSRRTEADHELRAAGGVSECGFQRDRRIASRIPGVRITADLFPLLGVSAALGRGLLPEDVEKSARVAVLSDALWRRRLGADRSAVGRTIRLDGETHTIAGIMPPGFEFPHPAYPHAHHADLWAPLVFTPNELLHRATYGVRVIGRLKASVPPERAAAELTAPGRRWQRDLPDYRGPHGGDGGWLLTTIPCPAKSRAPACSAASLCSSAPWIWSC